MQVQTLTGNIAVMVVRVRRVWVLWPLGDDDLDVSRFAGYLELVCVRLVSVPESSGKKGRGLTTGKEQRKFVGLKIVGLHAWVP